MNMYAHTHTLQAVSCKGSQSCRFRRFVRRRTHVLPTVTHTSTLLFLPALPTSTIPSQYALLISSSSSSRTELLNHVGAASCGAAASVETIDRPSLLLDSPREQPGGVGGQGEEGAEERERGSLGRAGVDHKRRG